MVVQAEYKVKGDEKPKEYRCFGCGHKLGEVMRDSSRALYLVVTEEFTEKIVALCYGYTRLPCPECARVTEWHPGKRALNVMLENRRTRAATLEALASKVDTK